MATIGSAAEQYRDLGLSPAEISQLLATKLAGSLTIRCGPHPDALQLVSVNDEASPTPIIGDHFRGHVLIRVNDFSGVLPQGAKFLPTSPYFDGHKRKMSFQFQGEFTRPWTADDLLWVNDWQYPLNVPRLMGMFTKFWAMTDPLSSSDLKSEKPYMKSYVVTAMCTINAVPKSELVNGHTDEGSDGDKSSNPDAHHLAPFRPHILEDINWLLPGGPGSAHDPGPTFSPRVSSVAPPSSVIEPVHPESTHSQTAPVNGATTAPPSPFRRGISLTETSPSNSTSSLSADSEASAPAQSIVQSRSMGYLPRFSSMVAAAKETFNKSTMQNKPPTHQLQNVHLTEAQNGHHHHGVSAKEAKLLDRLRAGGEDSVKERRKYFSSEHNRKSTVFQPGFVYGFEVFNPYFDPNTFTIRIPGVTLDMVKITNGQPMRTTLRSKDGTTFLVVEVTVDPAYATPQ